MFSRLSSVARIGDRLAAVEADGRFWTVFLVLLGAVTLSALSIVYTTFTSRHLLNELQALEKHRNKLQVEFGQLLLEQGSLVAQGRVEDTAIAELGMEVPDMNKVVVFKQ